MNIVMARPVARSYSGTFLETQARLLPAQVLDVPFGFSRGGLDGARALALMGRALWDAARRRPAPHGRADQASQARLFRCLRRLSPDVVLAQYGPTAAAITDACRRAQVPLVAHFHGYDVWRHAARERWLPRYRTLFAQGAGFVAVSTSMKQELVRLGAPADRVLVNPCGADLDDGPPADPAAAGPRFVSVGRLVDKKGTLHVLRAFAQLHDGGRSAQLTIIGDGPLRASLEAEARRLSLSDAVTFAGAVPHAEVCRQLRQSRALVHHSVIAPDGDREGTPVTVLEAGGLGLPVLGTRHEGIAEVVRHRETGLLCDEGDVATLAEQIAEVVDHPQRAAAWGANARATVRREHTAAVSVAKLRDYLRKVAQS